MNTQAKSSNPILQEHLLNMLQMILFNGFMKNKRLLLSDISMYGDDNDKRTSICERSNLSNQKHPKNINIHEADQEVHGNTTWVI